MSTRGMKEGEREIIGKYKNTSYSWKQEKNTQKI